MSKYTCHYCRCEASPRNLLRILTLPGRDTVINVCDLCYVSEYSFDVEAKQAILTAEIMVAAAAGDEQAVTERIGTSRVSSSAALFLL